MADTLNMESVRLAALVLAQIDHCHMDELAAQIECFNKNAPCPCREDATEAIRSYLAAEAERGMAMRPRAATAGMMKVANAHPITEAVDSAMVIAAVHGVKLPDDPLTPLEKWWTAMWDAGEPK